MRLFGSKTKDDEDREDQEVDEGGVQDPQPTDTEPVLPEDANLDELYGEDGSHLYFIEDEEGNQIPSDQYGNPIPATRPGKADPEPEPEPVKTPRQWSSPFTDDGMTEEEREVLAEGVDPKILAILDRRYSRQMDRVLAARDQQRAVAAEIGIPDNMLSQVQAAEQYVDPKIRGTRQGAIAAALVAVGLEAQETGDLQSALRKLLVTKEEAPVPAPRTLLPPSTRTPTPRTSASVARQVRGKGPRDTANESFHKDGIEGDVISIIRDNRKARR